MVVRVTILAALLGIPGWAAGALMFPEPYALQPQLESNGEIRPVDTDAPAFEVQEKPSLPVSVSSESDSWHIQPPQPGVFALLALVCWPILVRQRKDLPATWYW